MTLYKYAGIMWKWNMKENIKLTTYYDGSM